MVPVSWLPEFLSYPLYWLYLNQTLIAAGVALLAASLTVRAIQNQIRQQEQQELGRLRRRNRALRAALPYALTEFMSYAENCVQQVEELRTFQKQVPKVRVYPYQEPPAFDRWDAPSYPVRAASSLSDTIECCEGDDGKKLAAILAWGQVFDARLNDFFRSAKSRVGRVPKIAYHDVYYDALCLMKLVGRAFEYGRAREAHIGEICDVEDAISTLRVSMNIEDEALEERVRRSWPPSFHNYAEGLEDW